MAHLIMKISLSFLPKRIIFQKIIIKKTLSKKPSKIEVYQHFYYLFYPPYQSTIKQNFLSFFNISSSRIIIPYDI